MVERLKPRSVSVSDDLWLAVQEEAGNLGLTVSKWVREALIAALKDARSVRDSTALYSRGSPDLSYLKGRRPDPE
jgi:hypothetical protein